MEHNYKIKVSDEVVNFIKSQSVIVLKNTKTNELKKMFFMKSYYKEIGDNLFEIIKEEDLIVNYLQNNNETEDNS